MTEPKPGPRPSAVALAYGSDDAAPRVVARGQGLVAAQIIDRARAAGVFVHESKELLSLLMEVDLDREIPAGLYRAIAELLAWLYYVDSAQENAGQRTGPPDAGHFTDSHDKPAGTDAT